MGANPLLDPEKPVVFFDSGCLLCQRSVQFLLKYEQLPLYYAAFTSAVAVELLPAKDRIDPATFVLYYKGRTFYKSRAFFEVMRFMPWYWRWLRFFRLLPRALIDRIYDWVANHRLAWFGRADSCVPATPEQAARIFE
ncbi:MAG TPA: DUF393 domain-containing protein [Flammeovirgaceae bacterium]|nr:DUF393 domain-containing protein [Flammeovirgaceae bacterium]